MCSLVWIPLHVGFLLLVACAGLVTRCEGVINASQPETEACSILYTQIEDDKDPLHIMFLINECMATLTTELPKLQNADAEDMASIQEYSNHFSGLVTNLRNHRRDVEGHFGGKRIQVGDKQYESLAARTHNEFVNRVDKEMSSLYSWMKDTWSKEPIMDWAQQEVATDFDENGDSKAFKDADVDSSKNKHKMLPGKEALLNKATQRGWGKSHIKHKATQIDAYKDAFGTIQDLSVGNYQVSPSGCTIPKVIDELQVVNKVLCPSVKLHYAGDSTVDAYTFKVVNSGMGQAKAESVITLPKSIKSHLTDRPPVYSVLASGCQKVDGTLDILKVGVNDLCPTVKLEWTGRFTPTAYTFKVKDNGGGTLTKGTAVDIQCDIKTHLRQA